MTSSSANTLLLVLPVPFRLQKGELWFETQACNGLERWCENFEHVTIACPVMPDYLAKQDKTISWKRIAELQCGDKFKVVTLPWAYSPLDFLRYYRPTRNQLAQAIREARYLSFAIGGLLGDWASVACLESISQKRVYSVWTDNVTHKVEQRERTRMSLKHCLMSYVTVPLMIRYHRKLIRNAALGLFHGRDCFDAYNLYCGNAHCVHNIHLKAGHVIADGALQSRINSQKIRDYLQICYVGRAIHIKGPMDWLQAVKLIHTAGVPIKATWLGDGPMFGEMKQTVYKLGLNDLVSLPGATDDRGMVLELLRGSDVFMFCHKTQESPRCLIEALVSGCPIVGYDSAYAKDLLDEQGGGVLTTPDNVDVLAKSIIQLYHNRKQLVDMTYAAAKTGRQFNDVAVFKHRSDLIKKYL